MSDIYKTSIDYKVGRLRLFAEVLPEELHSEYESAIQSLVSEMWHEQNVAISAFDCFKSTNREIQRYKDNNK